MFRSQGLCMAGELRSEEGAGGGVYGGTGGIKYRVEELE